MSRHTYCLYTVLGDFPYVIIYRIYTIVNEVNASLKPSNSSQLMSEAHSKPGATLEKAAEHMMTCFRTCALDSKSSEEVTKRWGELA